jgi:hypothetical protein
VAESGRKSVVIVYCQRHENVQLLFQVGLWHAALAVESFTGYRIKPESQCSRGALKRDILESSLTIDA